MSAQRDSSENHLDQIVACPCCCADAELVTNPGPSDPADEYICGSCGCNFTSNGMFTLLGDNCTVFDDPNGDGLMDADDLVHVIARFSDDEECWYFDAAEPGDAHCPEDGEFSVMVDREVWERRGVAHRTIVEADASFIMLAGLDPEAPHYLAHCAEFVPGELAGRRGQWARCAVCGRWRIHHDADCCNPDGGDRG